MAILNTRYICYRTKVFLGGNQSIMFHTLNNSLDMSLGLLRDILALILLTFAVPIMMFGYIGVLPKNLGLEIFITFIAISIGYFAIDSLIEKYLSDKGFGFLNSD